MAAKKKFDVYLAEVESLRHAESGPEVTTALRTALGDRSNYLVSKAAVGVAHHGIRELIPTLLDALQRFYRDPVKSDAQCWAKNAIVKALADLGLDDAAVFLPASRHIQMEPVWGGQSDTAGPMRAMATLALVNCRSLPDIELIHALVDRLADTDHTVRAEAARACARVGLAEAALPLRMKALLGDAEPEVLGACFSAILALESAPAGMQFVERFADTAILPPDHRAEAALALGFTRTAEAASFLQNAWPEVRDLDLSAVFLTAIAATQQDAALTFLIELVEERPSAVIARAARTALNAARLSPELRDRLERAAT